MDSHAVYEKARHIIDQFQTRDVLQIAKDLGIRVYFEDSLTDLLGMYTARWNHRLMILNPNMDNYLMRMVIAHEIGHDVLHRNLAKAEGMREFVLFNLKDKTEYQANAFAAHLLLDNDEVYDLACQGYDVVQIAQTLGSNINLMLIKMQEMVKLGYNFTLPYIPDSRFFRNIKGSELAGTDYE